jgi:hypothetical protein
MRSVVNGIAVDAELTVVDGAGHGFSVEGRDDVDVLDEIAEIISHWILRRI